MPRLPLFAVMALAAGCAPGESAAGGEQHQSTRIAVPSDDPIMRAIEAHLNRSRENRNWALGPDLTRGEKLPVAGSLDTAVREARPYAATGMKGTTPKHVPGTPAASPAQGKNGRRLDLPDVAPLPNGHQLPRPGAHYLLQPADILDVAVSGYPELSGIVRVRRDGGVVLPGSGLIVRAAGRTAEAFSDLVATAIQGKVLKARPEVSVEIREGPSYCIYVRTPAGLLRTVPAAEAATLAALISYLDAVNGLSEEHTFKISYPGGGGTFCITARELLAGGGRGLPLTPGSVVEIIEPRPDGANINGGQASTGDGKTSPGLACRKEESLQW